MQQKGQVTVFVVVGLVVLLATAGIYTLVHSILKSELQSQKTILVQADPFANIVEGCLEQTGTDGANLLAMQGGYLKPSPSRQYFPYKVPYYFISDKNTAPEREQIESQLSGYVREHLQDCTDFSVFGSGGYSVNVDAPNVSIDASIQEEVILLKAHYPLEIRQGENTKSLDTFQTKIAHNLGKMHQWSQQILSEQENLQQGIPLGFITDMAHDQNFFYSTVTLGDTVVYSLFYETSRDNSSILQYDFAVEKHNSLLPPSRSSAPEETATSFSPPLFFQRKIRVGVDLFPLAYADPGETSNPLTEQASASDTGVDSNGNNPVQLQQLGDDDLLRQIGSDAAMLERPAVLQEFELRLNQPAFAEKVNANRDLLNRWAQKKGISFGDEGRLEKYETGRVTTKGADSVTFAPEIVPGAVVLESGKIRLPSGAVIADAELEKQEESLVVKQGQLDLRESKAISNIVAEKATVILLQYQVASPDLLRVKVEDDGSITLTGRGDLTTDGFPQFSFEQTITVQKGVITIRPGSMLTDYFMGMESVRYSGRDTINYVSIPEKCPAQHSCIERNNNEVAPRITITPRDNQIRILLQENPPGSLKIRLPEKEGEVLVEEEGNLWLKFTQEPPELIGNPVDLRTRVEADYQSRSGDTRTLRLIPGEQGVRVTDCAQKTCKNQGILSEESLLFMNAMRDGKEYENANADTITDEFEGNRPLRIHGYLDEPRELRVINALFLSAEKSGLDPYFVTSVAFNEGLAGSEWYTLYYQDPSASVPGYNSLGTDRFAKEQKALKKEGYLRENFGPKDYRTEGSTNNEAGEEIQPVTFTSIESAAEGMAAMLKRRQDLFLRDVRTRGLDPSQITSEQLNYWTYIYYNAGSGPPEDPKGKGRGIFIHRFGQQQQKGDAAKALEVPRTGFKATEEWKRYNNPNLNAQRVQETVTLLQSSGTALSETRKIALNEKGILPGGS